MTDEEVNVIVEAIVADHLKDKDYSKQDVEKILSFLGSKVASDFASKKY